MKARFRYLLAVQDTNKGLPLSEIEKHHLINNVPVTELYQKALDIFNKHGKPRKQKQKKDADLHDNSTDQYISPVKKPREWKISDMHCHALPKAIFQDMIENNTGKKDKKERTKDVRKGLNLATAHIAEKELDLNKLRLNIRE